MTPDELTKVRELIQLLPRLREALERVEAREKQQIQQPLDDASRNVIGGVVTEGAGPTTDLTDTITIGVGGGSANVPKAYSGTILLRLSDGSLAEVPRIS